MNVLKNQKIRAIAASCIGILLLIYTAYQFYTATKKGVATEIVTYGNAADSIQVQALAFREESIITNDYIGILSYAIADGSNVSKDSIVAYTYSDKTGAQAQTQLEYTKEEMDSIEKLLSPGDAYVSDPLLIGTQIYNSLSDLCFDVGSGDLTNISARRKELHSAVSRKNLTAGFEEEEDYLTKLEKEKIEYEALQSSAENNTGEIKTEQAGVFLSKIDGFEGSFSIEEIEELTPNKLNSMFEKQPEHITANTVGKIITNFDWYFAAVISEEEAIRIQTVKKVEIEVPYSSVKKISAEVIAKNKDPQTGQTVIILKCNTMSPDIAKIRKESIKITYANYSGLLVNEKSIHFIDYEETKKDPETGKIEKIIHKNVKGVYIKSGGRVKFVQIFSDKTMNGYTICKSNLSESEEELLVTDSTIRLYDEVIVSGEDLYDGKIII